MPSYLQIDRVSRITPRTAFLIGLAQIAALLPGTSRTTCIIIAALFLGCTPGTAAEFSFFLGVPMILFGALREIVHFVRFGEGFGLFAVPCILVGILASFAAASFSIRFLISHLKQRDYSFFVLYRFVLGIVIISYFAISALMA